MRKKDIKKWAKILIIVCGACRINCISDSLSEITAILRKKTKKRWQKVYYNKLIEAEINKKDKLY